MSQELRTEGAGPNFGIENFYSPEALYSLLTKDHLSHSYELQTNWAKIAEPGYDPITDVTGSVACDLKAKYTTGTDRFAKVFWFYSNINIAPSRFGRIVWSLGDQLPKLGIKATHVSSGPGLRGTYPSNHPYIILHGPSHNFYTSESDSFRVAISFDSDRKIRLVLPWAYEDLSDLKRFAKSQQNLLQNTEEMIKVVYLFENKDLPPVKLQFRAELEKSQEFLAECPYCQSNYFTAQSLSCPHCGASSPRFITKEE
jgi:hypothetical protein